MFEGTDQQTFKMIARASGHGGLHGGLHGIMARGASRLMVLATIACLTSVAALSLRLFSAWRSEPKNAVAENTASGVGTAAPHGERVPISVGSNAAATASGGQSSAPMNPTITLLNDVIGIKPELTRDDTTKVVQAFIDHEGDTSVQRWALVTAADRMRYAKMPDDARKDLEGLIINAMSHNDWIIRRGAIAAVDGSPFIARADIHAIVVSLAKDSQPEVAARAQMVLDRHAGTAAMSQPAGGSR